MSNISLKWIDGSPEKFEVGMLVVIDGEMKLIGDILDDGAECSDGFHQVSVNRVQRWTHLVRDYELQWHFEMMKGKK